VIFCLREIDYNKSDIYESVRVYFTKTNCSIQELETNQHFVYIQSPNLEFFQRDPKIYIIIDLEKNLFRESLNSNFLYKFYRVRYSDSKL